MYNIEVELRTISVDDGLIKSSFHMITLISRFFWQRSSRLY